MIVIAHDELLFRAILPIDLFWKQTNEGLRPSSAAFKDKKGLSTDRSCSRSNDECISFLIKSGRKGDIVSFALSICKERNIYVQPDPIQGNSYHTLVLSSADKLELTDGQAKFIAKNCILEYKYHL